MGLNKGIFALYPSEVTSFRGKAACDRNCIALIAGISYV